MNNAKSRGEQDGTIKKTAKGPREPPKLSIDETFEILKNERRRLVLSYLREHDEQVTLSDVADHVTAIENDTDVSSITSTERKRVYVSLYQFHLPKMADMGVVDYEKERGTISFTENGRSLYEEHENQDGRQWYLGYLCLAALGGVGLIASVILWQTVVAIGMLFLQSILLGAYALVHARTVTEGALEKIIR